MLNQVLEVSSAQEHVNSLFRMLSKSATFLDFPFSQGSVATYYRCGGNLCGIYIENFPTNQLVKEFENRSLPKLMWTDYQNSFTS